MSARIPRYGEVFRCEDGSAVVAPPGCDPLEGLLTLVEESYGGERFADDNPAIVAAVAYVRVETWHSCSKQWREANGVDDEWAGNWWAPDGDGRRSVTVAYYDGDAYMLGEQAEASEHAAEAAE